MNDSSKPRVSVLTPSFNQGRWLAENLKSVQAQTYPNIEHIVVDGGSTDDTLDILRNAAPNVLWTSEPDRGQSHALNKAFANSTGDIIGWINSDDAYIDRRSIEAAVQVFQDHPEVGVVYGHGLVLDEENRFMLALWSPPFVDRFLDLGVHFLQPTILLRRSMLPTQFVNEDLHYVMDWDLWLRMRKAGAQFKRIPMVVGMDRHQPERKTMSFSELDREFDEVASLNGIKNHRGIKVERKIIGIGKRWAGLTLAARITSNVQPAIDIDFHSTRRRIPNQGVLPRLNVQPPKPKS